MELEQAIEIVKAAGYKVSRPRAAKPNGKGRSTKGPTCVCAWADGTVTRMTVYSSDTAPDFARGIRVNAAAWQTIQRERAGLNVRAIWLKRFEVIKAALIEERGDEPNFQSIWQRTNDHFVANPHAALERFRQYRPLPLPALHWVRFERDGEVLAFKQGCDIRGNGHDTAP